MRRVYVSATISPERVSPSERERERERRCKTNDVVSMGDTENSEFLAGF